MFDFHEKRKIKSYVFSKFSAALILAISVWLSFSVYERFMVEREMSAKRVEREVELQRLQERTALLEEKVNYLRNERGIEEELRSRFDVAKQGEQTVVIIDDTKGSDQKLEELSVPPGADAQELSRPWWDFFLFW